MEETRCIKRVGAYSTKQAEPEDCTGCHNATWGTIIIKEKWGDTEQLCLDCYIKNLTGLGNGMPAHLDFRVDCCGYFTIIRDGGLYCNECGMNINEAIRKDKENE